MKQKLFLASVIILLSAFAISTQLGFVNKASAESPITGPVTSFAKIISGTVSYKFVGFLRKNKPEDKAAEGVLLEAKNIKTDEVFNTTTDSNGQYSLNVPAGIYLVSPSKGDIHFVPSVRAVNVKHRDERIANFKGLVFPHTSL